MALTTQQQATLKAFVEANAPYNTYPHTGDGASIIATLMKAEASPAFVVWKSSVTWDEIMQNGMDWTRVDNLSVGKARIWDWLFQNADNVCNPSKENVRAGIDATWVGTAADLAVRASVYSHCKRNANILEKLLATGTGSDADPAVMGYEGTLSYQDVAAAMQWPI